MATDTGFWVLTGGAWKRKGRPDRNPGGIVPTPRRFPGDPNPTITGRTYWGSSLGGNANPTAKHETPTGIKLGVHRTYFTWTGQIEPPGGAMLAQVRADHAANRLPWVSCKFPSWPTAASGGYDAQLDAIIAELESYAKPTMLTINHEPENDGLPAADFRAAQSRVRQRLTAYGTAHGGIKRVAFAGCLMAFTWNSTSGLNPLDWYPGAGVWDVMGVDHYTEVGKTIERANQWGNFVTWCQARSLPFAVGEWGLRGEDPNGPTKMQGFFDSMTDGTKDCIAMCYFDSSLNSTGTGWELDDENGLLTRFHQIMASPKTVHLSDTGF